MPVLQRFTLPQLHPVRIVLFPFDADSWLRCGHRLICSRSFCSRTDGVSCPGWLFPYGNENEVNIVKSVGDRYVSTAPEGMVGASSHRFWKFEAVEKGTQTLHFVYARGNVDEAIRKRDVTITVK